MSLTTDDLQQIRKIFTEEFLTAFEQVIAPYVDAKIEELRQEILQEINALRNEIDQLRGEMNELSNNMNTLRSDMNDHVISLHERIDETTGLIGHYFELCTPQSEHNTTKRIVKRLDRRVTQLETHHQ